VLAIVFLTSYIATLPSDSSDQIPSTDTEQIQPSPETKGAATTSPIEKITATVERVVDGDTLRVIINNESVTIRLIGIDTPETVDPRKPVECFGREASNQLKTLVAGKIVQLHTDSATNNRDKYNRLLRYVFLEDGTLINKAMIADGYAREYTYDIAYERQAEFRQAEAEAKQHERGLWAPKACIQTQ
jgi:micrococcal nuclease